MTHYSGKTKVLGVIGDPVSHTASPKMHMAQLTQSGLAYVYVPFHVKPEALQQAIEGLKALSIRGINVTIPHKEEMVSLCDVVDSEAKAIGAVNTVVNENGVLTGYNTDGRGFILSLHEELSFDVRSKKVVVVGAGGASRAIVYALLQAGVTSLVLSNRNVSRAESLMADMPETECECSVLGLADESLYVALQNADLIINTTSVGMGDTLGKSPFISHDWILSSHVCCDIIYSPPRTQFLEEAQKRHATVLNGAGMLAGQAVFAYEYFTNQPAEYAILRAEL